MKKSDFITKSLKGYFDDPSTCSLSDEGVCAYRGENDCRCAVGQYIKDEMYDPLMEGRAAYALTTQLEMKPEDRPTFEECMSDEANEAGLQVYTWVSMQNIHDTIAKSVLRGVFRSRDYERIDKFIFDIEKREGIKLEELRELNQLFLLEHE